MRQEANSPPPTTAPKTASGNDVAEQVVGQEITSKQDEVGGYHGGGCVVRIVVGDFRILLRHRIDDALPHVARVDEHVLLVHERHVLSYVFMTQLGRRSTTRSHAVSGVDERFGGHFVRKVHSGRTTRHLA